MSHKVRPFFVRPSEDTKIASSEELARAFRDDEPAKDAPAQPLIVATAAGQTTMAIPVPRANPKPATVPRRSRLSTYLADEEHEEVRDAARRARMTIDEWSRHVILHAARST